MLKYHIEARNWADDFWSINETTESYWRALWIRIRNSTRYDIFIVSRYKENIKT